MWRLALVVAAILASVSGCGTPSVLPVLNQEEEIVRQVVATLCGQSTAGRWLLLDPAGTLNAEVLQAVLSAHSEQLSEEARDALLQSGHRPIRDLALWDTACIRRADRRAAGFLSAVKDDPVAAWKDLQETEPLFRGTLRPSWLIHEATAGLAAVSYVIGTGPLGMEERVVILRAEGASWAIVAEEVVSQS